VHPCEASDQTEGQPRPNTTDSFRYKKYLTLSEKLLLTILSGGNFAYVKSCDEKENNIGK
ncbi:hypothetical protein CEXT_229751, partial [Caerostris extrusa]